MRQRIEAVALEGQDVRVTARDPLPVQPRALAIAAAIRVFDRFPALDRLTLAVGDARVTVSRQDVERLLGPDGFARLKDRDGAREVLERAIRDFAGDGTG
jgi:hypothetical protein